MLRTAKFGILKNRATKLTKLKSINFHEISVDNQNNITEYFGISFWHMDYKRQVFFQILCHIFESEMSMVPLKLVCNFSKYQIWQFAKFFLETYSSIWTNFFRKCLLYLA